MAKEERKSEKSVDVKLVLMLVLFGALLLMTTIQAMELNDLKSKVNAINENSVYAKPNSLNINNGDSTLQTNLNNLPEMVGGC